MSKIYFYFFFDVGCVYIVRLKSRLACCILEWINGLFYLKILKKKTWYGRNLSNINIRRFNRFLITAVLSRLRHALKFIILFQDHHKFSFRSMYILMNMSNKFYFVFTHSNTRKQLKFITRKTALATTLLISPLF